MSTGCSQAVQQLCSSDSCPWPELSPFLGKGLSPTSAGWAEQGAVTLTVLPTLRLPLEQRNLFSCPCSKLRLKAQYGLWLSERKKRKRVFKGHGWFLFNGMSFPDSVYFQLLAPISCTLGFISCSVCSRCLWLLTATYVFTVTWTIYVTLINIRDFKMSVLA